MPEPQHCTDQSCPAQKLGEVHYHDAIGNLVEDGKPYTQLAVRRPKEQVDHPSHYGGKDNPYETIKVLAAWRLGFLLGNCVKYISRAGKKDKPGASAKEAALEDLQKARFYLDEAIKRIENREELF